MSETKRPAWWPTAEQKLHADAGCAHPDECKVTPAALTPDTDAAGCHACNDVGCTLCDDEG